MMEDHESGGSAPPHRDQGSGTQGSRVVRRSRVVVEDREVRVADHPQVPGYGLAPRTTPTGKMASEHKAVPLLTSAALRGIAHHAAKLGSTLPVLNSDLPVMHADLPGLRPELPGSSVPLSGGHVRPLRRHIGELPRGRYKQRSEVNFFGHIAGVQQDVVASHSITGAHKTAPALSSGAACVSQAPARVSPQDVRRASLVLSEPRGSVPESETAEHDTRDGRRSENVFPGHYARVQQGAVAPHSTTAAHRTAPGLAPRAVRASPPVPPLFRVLSFSFVLL